MHHSFAAASSDHRCETDQPQWWENQTYPFSTLTPAPFHSQTTTNYHPHAHHLSLPQDCALSLSCVWLCPHGLWPARLLCPWDSPGKNTGVGCHALLQGIFPTQGPNAGLLCCGWVLYHLRHQALCLLLIGPSAHPLVQPLRALVFLDFGLCKLDLLPCYSYGLAYLNTGLSSSPWTSGPQVSVLTSPSTWELLIIFQPSLRLNIPTHYSIG